MALTDPQEVTIDSVAQELPRTGFGPSSGAFTKADGNLKLEVSHTSNSRHRHLIKLSQKKVTTDPLVPSQNIAVAYSVHIVLDMPLNGVSVDELAELGAGLSDWATLANLTEVVSGQS